ncbi:MAG TPA: DoxX family protein [Bryobacteraceae bacterium]|nr:DoxX family protein [Bryobacteraceae bacterium]
MNKNRILWIAQGVLAALFLFAGGVKLFMPADALVKQAPMFSAAFLRFVGTCEVLGGLGLILPWLLKIQPRLTPLAASALVIIMIGATAVTVQLNGPAMALFPAIVGLLLVWIAIQRFRMTPVLT